MNSASCGGSYELQPQIETKIAKPPSENKCKFCGKLYSSPASLRTHEKWHTGNPGSLSSVVLQAIYSHQVI